MYYSLKRLLQQKFNMEKRAVIHPDITPDLAQPAAVKTATDCASGNNVDNCKPTAAELDADFRKNAANKVAENLGS